MFLSDIPLHNLSRDFVLLAEQRQAEADLKERFEKLTMELRWAAAPGWQGARGGGGGYRHW
jgi:guanylate cyclase soluble subunit beta